MTVGLSNVISAAEAYGDARVDEVAAPLRAEISRLQAEADALRPKLEVGACNTAPGGRPGDDTLPNFVTFDGIAGPLTWRRHFPGLSAIAANVAATKAAGYGNIVSLKPGWTDAALTAAVKDLPGGTMLSFHHEPEDDSPSASWLPGYLRGYDITKAANPGVLVGPIANYWPYRTGTGVGDAGANTGPLEPIEAWDPDKCDFALLDWYSPAGNPIADSLAWKYWYGYWRQQGIPLGLAEYGQVANVRGGPPLSAAQVARRVEQVPKDFAYLRGCPEVELVCVYNGIGAYDWLLRDAESQAAFRAEAERSA